MFYDTDKGLWHMVAYGVVVTVVFGPGHGQVSFDVTMNFEHHPCSQRQSSAFAKATADRPVAAPELGR